ncbi:GNAT family N-acetyltransferase [Paenibacillus glucanolyticus]|uniref:GNAT family N-acetyltransferase n=1 Tax=Paenibacillus glucanolyticus TaxID=59843 RepID=UPI0034CFF0B8
MQMESKRLMIRDFQEEDWASIHAYASDPLVTEYTMWGPNTEEDTSNYLKEIFQMMKQNPRDSYELAIVLKENGRLIGGVGLHRSKTNAELGYCLNSHYWRQGYATEAARAMSEFGFKELGVNRIFATCRPGNVGSAGVMCSIGMKQEGHLRQHLWFKGGYHDSYLFSLLREEFEARNT